MRTQTIKLNIKTIKISLFITLFALGGAFIPMKFAKAQVGMSDIVSRVNQERANHGLSPLQINNSLAQSATMKAQDMSANQYFAHNSPSGKSPWYFFGSVGYAYLSAGENLAVDYSDTNAVMRAWMNSTTHRANILNPNYTEIGVGIVSGTYNGHQTYYIVQHFGKPVAQNAIAKRVNVAPKANANIAGSISTAKMNGISVNLRKGMRHEEVRELQRYLNTHGYTVATSGAGSLGNETNYFGMATYRAVLRFQEANASEILAPAKLRRATGYVGPSTRAKINA